MTRNEIVAEARSWEGSTWQHQASLKNVACDCVGLIRGVYKELTGIVPDIPFNYSATWPLYKSEEKLYNECTKVLIEIPVESAGIGDVVLFGFGKGPASHIGIKLSDKLFIHSYMDVNKVVETEFDSVLPKASRFIEKERAFGYTWCDAIRFAFKFSEVTD